MNPRMWTMSHRPRLRKDGKAQMPRRPKMLKISRGVHGKKARLESRARRLKETPRRDP